MRYVDITCAPALSSEEVRALEGTFVDDVSDVSWTIIRPDMGHMVRVQCNDTNKLLCIVHRNAISHSLCDMAVDSYISLGKQVSTNRGVAAGMQHRDHTFSTYDRGAKANSSIMGYMDSTHYKRPCRLTAFSAKHVEKYSNGLPFIRAIDRCFRDHLPDAYDLQRREAQITDFHIQDTAFSTVTVNYNFRTAVHKDTGDFEKGFGNLVVCQQGVDGGWVLFPRYRVAIVPQTGDFIAMDVHEWHCNTSIVLTQPDGYRLSFVCYLRNRMRECKEKNARIESFPGTLTTEQICRQIFESVGESLPEKTFIGSSQRWWSYQGNRFHILYKNRRFIIHDLHQHRTIHNLWPAWEYARTLFQ